jgi:ElaB/YqjD/DUF883 family membrane-anchored ribosome-binding protein
MDEQDKGVSERWAPTTSSARGRSTEPRQGADVVGRGDLENERRTSEIRSDIESTRADMKETVDAIQERLRPRNVVSRAAQNVRDATVERVRSFAGRSGEHDYPRRAADWYRGNGIVARIRENPLPAVIAGVSIAWLAFGKRPSRDYEGPPPYEWEPDLNAYGAEDVELSGERYSTERHDDRFATTGEYGGSEESWRDRAGHTMGRAQHAMRGAGQRARRATWSAQSRLQRMTHDNPIAVAGLAAAVGAAIGLAIPETERENELMGEARDTVVDRAKDAARSAAERVQDTAKEVQKVASKAISATDKPSGTSSQAGSSGQTGTTGLPGTPGRSNT